MVQNNPETVEGSNEVRPVSGNTATSHSLTGIRFEKRKLTQAEATCLHEELKSTANILGYTVPELLRFSQVLVAVAESDGSENLAGVCLLKDLLWGWTEISVVYVLPGFRGRGISSHLFTTAFGDAQDRKRHIYVLSRSPEVIHLMKRLGMETTCSVWNAPLSVHLEMNRHMMSLYRWREASRKMAMRKDDGYKFLSGIKRV